jgi:hypothetical protein
MTRKESIWNKVSAPGVLLVLTALCTGLFIAPSFESARPRSPALPYDPVRTVGRASGLITFDPLEQAYEELGSPDAKPWSTARPEECARFSMAALARGLVAGATFAGDANRDERVLVLLESVRGGGLSEDHERRLRGRYATAAALVREGLFPRQSKRLNLLWLACEPDVEGQPKRAFADPVNAGALVPYEYFDRGDGSASPYPRVAVCWVDEAAIERDPLQFGLQFEAQVRSELAKLTDLGAEFDARVDVRWLGPTTSGRLKDLIAGVAARPEECKHTKLKIATPYATSPLLELEDGPEWTEDGLSIRRAVHTDAVLARLLVNELMLRVPALMPMHHAGDRTREAASPPWVRTLAEPLRKLRFVPPPSGPVRVALITEQDSTYGQAWIRNMSEARNVLAGTNDEPGLHPQLARIEFTVFPVFGWVDGIVREARDKKDASAAMGIGRDYPAEAHQLDYLHRLRDDLQSTGAFAAIAIFVTEEYDTMMILEALRPQFPGATFLTTDLDARYLHARHAPFTRNLVVASHFGLTPDPLPGEVAGPGKDGVLRTTPEFRDGYQSGVWRAVRALALNLEPLPPDVAAVYEIGRSRIVKLNSESAAVERKEENAEVVAPSVVRTSGAPSRLQFVARALREWRPWSTVQATERSAETGEPAAAPESELAGVDTAAPASNERPRFVYLWALGGGGALLLGLLVFGTRPRSGNSRRWRTDSRTLIAFVSIGVATLGLILLLDFFARSQEGFPAEPMFLLEGVSAWPTIALRGVMFLVCIAALVTIPQRLRRVHQAIALHYRLSEYATPTHAAWIVDWACLDEFASAGPSRAPTSPPRLRLRELARGVKVCFATLGCLFGVRPPPTLSSRRLDEVWAFVRWNVRRPLWTWVRMLGLAAVLYLGVAPFFILANATANPVRGEYAYLVDRISLFGSVFAFLMLMVLVMESSFFASRLIGRIVDPSAVVLPERFGELAVDRRERLELARRIASAVDPLVWSPMVVLGLMIAARASVFDAWPWPSVLMGVFALFFVMLLMCIVNMRRQCERARRDALEHMAKARETGLVDEASSKRYDAIREQIEDFAGGAFSPLIQHPILRALTLPLTAFGANLAFERSLLERLLGAL